MKNRSLFLVILSIFLSIQLQAQHKNQLFNGDNLNNWDIHIGTALDGFEELKSKAKPETIYSVINQDGEKLIRISGETNASLATKKEFSNYHLRLEFKWGENVFTTRNSGLLYHSYGEMGAGIGTWMSSIELQLMHDNLGDAYMMADTYAEINVTDIEKNKVFAPTGKSFPFGNEQEGGKIARKQANMEKPIGDWNVVDLYCFGQKSIHVVNGKKVMECQNTGKLENGKTLPLSKGKIQIQSEGGELFIRKIEIEKITKLPETL